MGEIVIKVPGKKNRRYVVTDAKRSDELISALDKTAIRVKSNPMSPDQLEYIQDVRDIEKALAEYLRTGKTYKWESVKAEAGL